MSGPNGRVNQVMMELRESLQSIAELNNKIAIAYDKASLVDALRGVTYPAMGIIYEGCRAQAEPPGGVGVSSEIIVTFAIVANKSYLLLDVDKVPIIQLLDEIRGTLIGKRAVTGHRYRFMQEFPAVVQNDLAFWNQQWAVPVQFPPNRG